MAVPFLLQGQWTFYDDYIVLEKLFWPFDSPFAMAHRAVGRDQTLFAWYFLGVSWLFGTNAPAHYLASSLFHFGTVALLLAIAVALRAPVWSVLVGLCCVVLSSTVPEQVFTLYKTEKALTCFIALFLWLLTCLISDKPSSRVREIMTGLGMAVTVFASGTMGKETFVFLLPTLGVAAAIIFFARPDRPERRRVLQGLLIGLAAATAGSAAILIYRKLIGVTSPTAGEYTQQSLSLDPRYTDMLAAFELYEFHTRDVLYLVSGSAILCLLVCAILRSGKLRPRAGSVLLIAGGFALAHTIFYIVFWRSVHIYYLYPSAVFAGLALMIGPVIFKHEVRWAPRAVAALLIGLTAIATLHFAAPMFWLRAYALIAAQRADTALAMATSYLPARSIVAVNFPAGEESVYGMKVLVERLYGRSDIVIGSILDPKFRAEFESRKGANEPAFLGVRFDRGSNWAIGVRAVPLGGLDRAQAKLASVNADMGCVFVRYRGEPRDFRKPVRIFHPPFQWEDRIDLQFDHSWMLGAVSPQNLVASCNSLKDRVTPPGERPSRDAGR